MMFDAPQAGKLADPQAAGPDPAFASPSVVLRGEL
jgi:hypothetical protein